MLDAMKPALLAALAVVLAGGCATTYLGSPRMAEMVIGEKVTLEEMGGAKMHCSVPGCGDVLVKTDQDAIMAIVGEIIDEGSRRRTCSRRPG